MVFPSHQLPGLENSVSIIAFQDLKKKWQIIFLSQIYIPKNDSVLFDNFAKIFCELSITVWLLWLPVVKHFSVTSGFKSSPLIFLCPKFNLDGVYCNDRNLILEIFLIHLRIYKIISRTHSDFPKLKFLIEIWKLLILL